MTKKFISIILSAVLAFSMASVAVVSASAATDSSDLTVKVKSNYFPEATEVFNSDTNQITVNYNFKSSKDLLNLQWRLTYDTNVFSLSKKNTAATVCPSIGENGVYNFDDSTKGVVLGNATSLGLYTFSKEVTPLVSLTFDVNKDYLNENKPVNTEINLTVQYMAVSKLGADLLSDDAEEVYLLDNDGIVQTGSKVDAVTTVREVAMTSSTDPTILGDVDGNGKIQVSDATLVQKYVAHKEQLTDGQITIGDVNKDGKTNISDATLIQKYVAKKIISF